MDARVEGLGLGSIQEINALPREVAEALYARLVPEELLDRFAIDPHTLCDKAGARLVTERAGEADVVVPRVGEQWETLHACYGKACLAPIEARLRAGRLKIIGFYDEVRVLEIPASEIARYRVPDVVVMNVNTPEELEAARVLLPALEPNAASAEAS